MTEKVDTIVVGGADPVWQRAIPSAGAVAR